MTLQGVFDNMFIGPDAPIMGISLAGTINVEKAFVEISSDYFIDCGECDATEYETVRNCATCGRYAGNNFNFLAGRGDGVYSGVEFLGSRKSSVAYLFDEGNQFASEVSQALSKSEPFTEWGELFFPACEKYLALPALDCGTINVIMGDPDDNGILIGGTGGFSDLSAAKVDHPTTTGTYRILLFVEPEQSNAVASNGSLLRPRVILLVPEEDAQAFVTGTEVFTPDWSEVSDSWSNATVASNVGPKNGAVSYYYNGVYFEKHLKHLGESYLLEVGQSWTYIAWLRAFGYFWLGMALGDEDCLAKMLELFKRAGGFNFVDFEVYKSAGKIRGLSVTKEHWEDFQKLIATQIIAGNLR
jgi:hypothetical protein